MTEPSNLNKQHNTTASIPAANKTKKVKSCRRVRCGRVVLFTFIFILICIGLALAYIWDKKTKSNQYLAAQGIQIKTLLQEQQQQLEENTALIKNLQQENLILREQNNLREQNKKHAQDNSTYYALNKLSYTRDLLNLASYYLFNQYYVTALKMLKHAANQITNTDLSHLVNTVITQTKNVVLIDRDRLLTNIDAIEKQFNLLRPKKKITDSAPTNTKNHNYISTIKDILSHLVRVKRVNPLDNILHSNLIATVQQELTALKLAILMGKIKTYNMLLTDLQHTLNPYLSTLPQLQSVTALNTVVVNNQSKIMTGVTAYTKIINNLVKQQKEKIINFIN